MIAKRQASLASSGTPNSSMRATGTSASRARSPAHQDRIARATAGDEELGDVILFDGARHSLDGECRECREQIVGRDLASAHGALEVRQVEVLLARRLGRRHVVVRVGEQELEQVAIDRTARRALATAVERLAALGEPGHGRVHQARSPSRCQRRSARSRVPRRSCSRCRRG